MRHIHITDRNTASSSENTQPHHSTHKGQNGRTSYLSARTVLGRASRVQQSFSDKNNLPEVNARQAEKADTAKHIPRIAGQMHWSTIDSGFLHTETTRRLKVDESENYNYKRLGAGRRSTILLIMTTSGVSGFRQPTTYSESYSRT